MVPLFATNFNRISTASLWNNTTVIIILCMQWLKFARIMLAHAHALYTYWCLHHVNLHAKLTQIVCPRRTIHVYIGFDRQSPTFVLVNVSKYKIQIKKQKNHKDKAKQFDLPIWLQDVLKVGQVKMPNLL